MPTMTIVNVDGQTVDVEHHATLEMEIRFFEEAIDALEPLLDCDDDLVAQEAEQEFDRLTAGHAAIVALVPAWNEAVAAEHRERRKAKAEEIRERRRKNAGVKIMGGPDND